MKTRSKILTGAVVALFVLAALPFGLAWFSRRPVEVGMVDGRLRPCPSPSNCVCSEDEGESSIAGFPITGDAEATFQSLVGFLEEEGEGKVELRSLSKGYIHAVYLTPVLGFADDVEFRLDRETQTIQVRSASRIGRSDLGANRARIEDLRTRWSPGP